MALRDNIKKDVVLEEQVNSEQQLTDDIIDTKPTSLRSQVKTSTEHINRGKAKKERFLWVKVWISYLLSLFMKDRGKIPDNIGDKIMITNNLYITKLYLSTIIQITELGTYTPVTMIQVLNNALRDRGNKAVIDFSCKNKKYDYDEKDSGLGSRINMWENNISNPATSKKIKDRSTRCLYTVEVARTGVQLKQSRMYITLRAKDIYTLNAAEKIVFSTLATMGCMYLPVYAGVKKTLEYISLIGNKVEDVKTIMPVMSSNVILSQIAPNCGSYNDKEGYYIGQNIQNGTPYLIDFNDITVARNMYVVAPSGVGKTVLAVNMAQSAYENGSACCFMDIKGNEYTNFINATNGHIVSLRPTSIEFINTWIMHKEDVTPETAEAYFKSRISFSKQQMIILSGIRNREALLQFEELLDEFHQSLYITLGAIPTNSNSWRNTEGLHPYEVFSKFETYLTPQKRAQYSIHNSVIGTLRMYMSATGSKSYVFKKEFDYSKILSGDTVSFDFGILKDTTVSDIDEDLFRLKFLYMSKLNGEFTSKKYSEGKRTFKILEESQVVSPEIMKMYVQEYTLRRSQNQDTLLLGNSVQSLTDSEIAKPLIENTRGLFIGELTKDARDIVLEQFGIRHLESLVKLPGSSKRYKNCFAFINNMQNRSLYPIIQVQIEAGEDGKPKKYKINTPVKEQSIMSGS